MHLVPPGDGDTLSLLHSGMARRRLLDRLKARLVGLASRVDNYRSFTSGPGVTVDFLREGNVGVALSVLYCPHAELDGAIGAGAPSADGFGELLRQLELVEREIAGEHAQHAAIAHDPAELDAIV